MFKVIIFVYLGIFLWRSIYAYLREINEKLAKIWDRISPFRATYLFTIQKCNIFSSFKKERFEYSIQARILMNAIFKEMESCSIFPRYLTGCDKNEDV